MNRPTIDVDDLILMAEEASAEGDFAQAVTILRKAAAVAPLRKDIRNRLAVALERTPVPQKPSRHETVPVQSHDDAFLVPDYDEAETYLDNYGDAENGREAISDVARKAFKAAAGTTAKAGVATRHLSNLLNQGIQTWKSSLVEQSRALNSARRSGATVDATEAAVSTATQAGVFTAEADLKNYLNGMPGSGEAAVTGGQDRPASEKLVRPAPVSQKSTRTYTPKKSTARQTDVEDVLAAGIDGFIEVVSNTDKKKFLYGFVYVGLISLFSYACFDVSRKFPAVQAVPGETVVSASMGALDLSDSASSQAAIFNSHALLNDGKYDQAISLLESQLASGKMLKNRDRIRVELATVLNEKAENDLRNNLLAESVATYKKALDVLPGDAALKVRLSNALYYLGTVGTVDSATKKSALGEARDMLEVMTREQGDNLQAHRLLALIHEASGDDERAEASWKIVKEQAPAGSAELAEAAKHLK